MALEHWELDGEHSSLQVAIRHMGIAWVRGTFGVWGGTLLRDVRTGALQVEIQINLASLRTGSDERDDHLKGPDFLDVEHFPYATFSAARAERLGPRRYLVMGSLVLKGQRRDIPLEVEHSNEVWSPFGTPRVGFEVHATLDRRDFGVGGNVLLVGGGLVVGDEIQVSVEAEAVRQPAAEVGPQELTGLRDVEASVSQQSERRAS